MHQPLISIITVVFNAEKVLLPTLQSAIDQSYKNIELVIVDGGSTDNSISIAKQFSVHIGTFISEKDDGIYDAMNKGIKAAKGEWLYFLNAGDTFYDTEVLASIFSNSLEGINLIYGKVETMNEPSGINYINGSEVVLSDFYTRFPLCHQASFTRKSCFDFIGYYDLRYKMVADHQWFIRFFIHSNNQSLFLNRLVAYYDVQGSSYHKRMQSQRELISYGRELFPTKVWVFNILSYPVVYIKVSIIRAIQHTSIFKLYRNWKFKHSTFQQQLPV
jgi:glycosyltransferase involved in cell wall biosynthesis